MTETGGRGWAHAPTEREPSTAIFLFFKMSLVIAERVEERRSGEGRSGEERIKGRGEGL